MRRLLLLAFTLAVAGACVRSDTEATPVASSLPADPSATVAATTPPIDLATVEIVLERTECYGLCPAYTVKIAGDGTVRYHGSAYVREIGDLTGHIEPAVVRELVARFDAARFSELGDAYVATVTDGPTTFIEISRDGKRKRVENYGSATTDPAHRSEHERLDALADAIDRAVRIEGWIGTEAERRAAGYGPGKNEPSHPGR